MGETILTHGLASQLLASLDMLKDCIDRCPEEEWNGRHEDRPFSQVVLHALFDCDDHLCDHDEAFKEQVFHREGNGLDRQGVCEMRGAERRGRLFK